MKTTTTATKNAWLSGEYTGPNRPMARVVVQKMRIMRRPYEFTDRFTDKTRRGRWTSALFGQNHTPIELPNLAYIRWSRDVDQDVQTCEMRFYNTAPLPPGATPDSGGDFDQPGFYTGGRGEEAFSSRWGHVANTWQGLLVPDRILKTYEGYGFDPDVGPEDDPNMYPSGVWLIDKVDYQANAGMITVTCRDLGRLLLEHIHFPPVIPYSEYPLWWEKYYEIGNDPELDDTGDEWIRPTYQTDSNQPYVGSGITDGGMAYVQANGAVYGHHGSDAFDGKTDTYWLSVGNLSTWSSAFEYVQGKFAKADIGAVKVNVKAGPYVCFVSIYADGEWKGTKDIPYGARVIDTEADIPFVKRVSVDFGEAKVIKLPKIYKNATRVRITLTRLWDSGLGVNYQYRGAIQEVKVLKTSKTSMSNKAASGKKYQGNYEDFTDIVKWVCAWAGFLLPPQTAAELAAGKPGSNFIKKTSGAKVTYTAAGDAVLGSLGRVWGDFENTGTYAKSRIDVDTFNMRPLMDAISYIRDIVNFSFWVDETGGVVWRSPNIWSLGNYLMPALGGPSVARTAVGDIVDIDETTTLVDLMPTLDSRNMRERVIVANVPGRFAAASAGYIPYPSGMRRTALWSDQNFEDLDEAQVMADLITVRQAWTFREDTLTIAANPAIQIDDQVRIFERTSEEGFYHYVKSITSEWSLEDGSWRYTLGTHWLGEDPTTRWAFDAELLAEQTKNYLTALGKM